MSLDRTFCVRFAEGECRNDEFPYAACNYPIGEWRNSWADRKTEGCGYVPPTKEPEA